jgi:excisionase family DNA binding protein
MVAMPAHAIPRTAAAFRPPARERARLQALRSALDGRATKGGHNALTIDGTSLDMPPVAVKALTRVVEYLASGEPVLIIPADEEVTTGEAATILNFSRQYLVRLLDEGKIPYRREGSHRRLLLRDVIRYREKRVAEQRAAITEMIRQSQEVGAYDWTEEQLNSFSRGAEPTDTS